MRANQLPASCKRLSLPDLIPPPNRLRVDIGTKAPKAPVFSLPADYEMAEMLRTDLQDARKARLQQVRHDPEKFANREQSDLLNVKNHENDSLDFHALRHTCGAWLAMSGAHPKSIQSVMRHSSIVLTMDTYGHLIPGQEAETVARMSNLFVPDQPQTLRATGTIDVKAANSDKPPEKRCALRCESGASSCVAGATTTNRPTSRKSRATLCRLRSWAASCGPMRTKTKMGPLGFEPRTKGL